MRRLLFLLICCSCSSDLSDEAIAPINFPDKVINLTFPEFNDLRTKGYMYLNDIGVRGVILYRVPNSQEYRAFERNCTFHPNSACATVEVDSPGFSIIDPCGECGSSFNFDGRPNGGPAITPLRRYDAAVDGSVLRITDTIIQ